MLGFPSFLIHQSNFPRRQVGIIGGTGLEDPQLLEDAKQVYISTPYGDPSDLLTTGRIGGVPCILLSRHGRRHQHSPSAVNYRANIWALKSLGILPLFYD